MNKTVYQTGKRFERMVLLLALAFLFICLAYALIYVYFLTTDKPLPTRRSSFYMIVATGLFFSLLLCAGGWFLSGFIRYELCSDCLRISKGRFLRLIDYSAIQGVRDTYSGRKNKKQYVIVLKSGTGIAVSPYIENAEDLVLQLNERVKRNI